MNPVTRIIGIGSASPGDDAAGIEVARRIACTRLPAGVEVHQSADPADLLQLAAGCARVIIIDAVIDAESPGRVIELDVQSLDDAPTRLLSSHGLSVARALALCGTLHPLEIANDIRIVAITIALPGPGQERMSPTVVRAIARAAVHVLCLAQQAG